MGLNNRNANIKYVRVKDGKFYLAKDKEFQNPYTELEGTITKAYYKNEEFEGNPIKKFIINISDDEDTYQIGLNVESTSYSSLISFLANIDVTKPVCFHPKMDVQNKDGKEVTKRTMLVSQNGKFAKSYFTKEDPKGLPAWNVVKVGNKKVTDKSEFLAFLEDFSMKNIFSAITEEAPKVKVQPTVEEEVSNTDDSSLPWD